jgi:molybdopterin synthase sulfur carrier subunit
LAVRVSVLYFGQAREAAGTSEEGITVPDGSPVEAALQEARKRHSSLSKLEGILQVAVNEEIVKDTTKTMLREGDTVAVLPPVAGG